MSGTKMMRAMNFGDRLQLGKILKLLLFHFDLGDLVVEHPSAQHGEPASLGVREHRFR